jgi:hypothetical protein
MPAAATQPAVTDTHSKALELNLDTSVYGTFAEIGAGQEVARWFLSVGAASGTVAQTISAYDKTFSDDTYGSGTRYVSRDRLIAMLDHEYKLLVERLGPTRGKESRFFAFADTVASRNYKGDNEQHGWVGLRFQTDPGAAPSDILLHVNLRDATSILQQQALGILGVNLLYASARQRDARDRFLQGLWDDLSLERLEIDCLELSGPAFSKADVRDWCVQLLRRGMARAIAFDTKGAIVPPTELLHKRPLIVDRGRFITIEDFHGRMLDAAQRQLRDEGIPLARDPISLLEITIRPAGEGLPEAGPNLLERIDGMCRSIPGTGGVLATSFGEMYELVDYIRRYTTEPSRFVIGVSLLVRLFEDRFYNELPGRLLEGIGKVFAHHIKIYVSPMPRQAVLGALGPRPLRGIIAESATGLVSADDLRADPPVSHLYQYLRSGGWVVPLTLSAS